MFDPKVYFIKRSALRLARKLASLDVSEKSDVYWLLKSIHGAEAFFDIKLSVSQIASAYLIYRGYFVQLATGEGKTYSIALAAAWLSEAGQNVHILVPNDYLASRDQAQTQGFFHNMGISSSCIIASMDAHQKAGLYLSDVVYSTPACIAFDRMRECFKTTHDVVFQSISQETHLILDEVDAVLIENGAVPFIASQYASSNEQEWFNFVDWARTLEDADVYFDVDTESTQLTNFGYESLERYCLNNRFIRNSHDLYTSKSSGYFHKGVISVRALYDMNENEDYILKEGGVKIINQSTGRIEADRQWGSGLHQAIEVKHGFAPSNEMSLRSRMTIPDLVLLYKNFSGTSATVIHADDEILKRYGKLSIEIPRNHKDQRLIHDEVILRTEKEKQELLIKDVSERHLTGQPILIGVDSISEALDYSRMLSLRQLEHQTLTAREESKEADIIAKAGLPGRITIATNMAGRGTDIRLGDEDPLLEKEALEAGGLYVVSTSRQKERRLDEQLAGRTGRQGAVGEVRFYVSMEDDIFLEQEKLPDIKKITPRFIRKIQSSCANKIGMSREEIDSLNSAMITQTRMYLDLRTFWVYCSENELLESITNIYIQMIRELLSDYTVYKMGVYSDYEGFLEVVRSRSQKIEKCIFGLDNKYEGYELCAEVEKSVINLVGSSVINSNIGVFRQNILCSWDQMWSEHLVLIEQIYDHSKWQSLIQKNDKIQFVILAFDAFKILVEDMERKVFLCMDNEVCNG